jgi:hypothetical protein
MSNGDDAQGTGLAARKGAGAAVRKASTAALRKGDGV